MLSLNLVIPLILYKTMSEEQQQNTNPVERVIIHETKVIGSWGHHGIKAPAFQVKWPDR